MEREMQMLAWNAAYWLARSESRRQQRAVRPDCDWPAVEAHEDCIEIVLDAQARLCMDAMKATAGSEPWSLLAPSVETTFGGMVSPPAPSQA